MNNIFSEDQGQESVREIVSSARWSISLQTGASALQTHGYGLQELNLADITTQVVPQSVIATTYGGELPLVLDVRGRARCIWPALGATKRRHGG